MDLYALARIFLALIFVVALVLACAWLARRNRLVLGTGSRASLSITNKMAVGPRGMQVMIVEVEGERLLLGVTPGSINVLHTLAPESPSTAISEPNAPATFQGILQNLLRRKPQ